MSVIGGLVVGLALLALVFSPLLAADSRDGQDWKPHRLSGSRARLEAPRPGSSRWGPPRPAHGHRKVISR